MAQNRDELGASQDAITAPAHQQVLPLVLISVTVILILRLFWLIDRYAVNLLYWDQWDFLQPLFNQASWLAKFRWQHGPHRQGCGLFVSELTAALTAWDSRAEGFVIAAIVILALGLAFWLRRRLVGPWEWSDLLLPLLFLSPLHFEIFLGAPNPAHGALPLLLLMAYGLAWTIPGQTCRLSLVLLFNLLLIYTGFGVFVGLLTPLLIGVCCIQEYRLKNGSATAWHGLALLTAVASGASFLVGYAFQSANPDFQLVPTQPWQYFQMVAVLFGHFLGLRGIAEMLVGTGVVFACLLTLIVHIRRLWRGSQTDSLLITCFIAFTLLFCAMTAYGRASYGIEQGRTSRYGPYLLPAFLGLYFHLLGMPWQLPRQSLVTAFVVLAVLAGAPIHHNDSATMAHLHDGKQRWKDAYLTTGNVREANRIAGYQVYPDETSIDARLAFLRRYHLNLFHDQLDQSGIKLIAKNRSAPR